MRRNFCLCLHNKRTQIVNHRKSVGVTWLLFLSDYNRNTRTRCEICSKLTIKTPEPRWRRSGVFIINFKHIPHLSIQLLKELLYSFHLTYNLFHITCSSVSIVNFEHVIASWACFCQYNEK